MYPSLRDVRSPVGAAGPAGPAGPAARAGRRVPANVVYLGLTSLFTDISSEMVNSVLPLYLAVQLGLGRFQFGVFNGTYQAVAALTALAGAGAADRRRRYKAVAGAGYAVSAATRLGLLLARHSWAPAAAMLYADRAAKGVRTAPRDALVSLSAEPGRVGTAFGVHRALDTVGALAGPVVAFAVLSAVPQGYGTIFMASFWVAVVGLAVLALYVRDVPAGSDRPARSTVTLRSAATLLAHGPFRRLVAAAMLLGAVTIGDALVYLTFQQRTTMTSRYFPLLYAGTAITYVLLAVPAGRLADRVRPARVFLAGQALLLVVDSTLLVSAPGRASLVVMLVALGLYYAATDGVLAALATGLLPSHLRASGLALLGVATALAQLVASTVFGWIWSRSGSSAAVAVMLGGLAVALVASVALLGPLLARGTAPAGHAERPTYLNE